MPIAIAKINTLIKSRPVPSSDLPDEDLVVIAAGQRIGYVTQADAADQHLLIKFSSEINNRWSGYLFAPHWDFPEMPEIPDKKKKTSIETAVPVRNVSQPDQVTCQSACIAMVLKDRSVSSIRSELVGMPGGAGSPLNMGQVLSKRLGSRYSFDGDASLAEARDWLKNGEFLITHGWFTDSGHVIGLDGVEIDPGTLSYRFNVKDPWSEFDGPSWSYNRPDIAFYDGFYSARLMYASCVSSTSRWDAQRIYHRGELDSKRGGAWMHRIRP